MDQIYQDETNNSPVKGLKKREPLSLEIYKVLNSLRVSGKHTLRLTYLISIRFAQFDFVRKLEPVSLQWRAHALGSFGTGVIECEMGNGEEGLKLKQYSFAVEKAVLP